MKTRYDPRCALSMLRTWSEHAQTDVIAAAQADERNRRQADGREGEGRGGGEGGVEEEAAAEGEDEVGGDGSPGRHVLVDERLVLELLPLRRREQAPPRSAAGHHRRRLSPHPAQAHYNHNLFVLSSVEE